MGISACGGVVDVTEEFLVVPSNGSVRIYGVHDLPSGTFIGRDAQKLRVVGPVWVKPPRPELAEAQWPRWQDRLREAGFSVTLGPFWTNPNAFLPLEEMIRGGATSRPLEEVRDELLRSARD